MSPNIWENFPIPQLKYQWKDLPAHEHHLEKGIRFLNLPKAGVKVGRISLVFSRFTEGRGVPLVEDAITELLGQSTPQFNEALEQLGAKLHFSANSEWVFLTIVALESKLAASWDLIQGAILEAHYSPERLTVFKEQQREYEKLNWSKGKNVASHLHRSRLFADFPKYADVPLMGDEDVLTPNDLKEGTLEMLRHLKLVAFMGKVPNALEQQVRNWSLGLELQTDSQPKSYFAKSWEPPVLDNQQSSLRLGVQCPNRFHPDYPLFLWANTLISGFFGARLNKVLREEKGLTYGIHGGFQHNLDCSVWGISGEIKQGSEEACVAVLQDEIENLLEKVDGSFFDLAQSYSAGSVQLQSDSIFAIGDNLISEFLAGGNPDFYKERMLKKFDFSWQDFQENYGKIPAFSDWVLTVLK